MSISEFKNHIADKVAALYPKLCECGVEREPERVMAGCISMLICARCDGRTTERKY